ncbi:hypothetical protein J437_LFUL006685 [Ladona fulva]|uniref:Orange domain-containing protein n=1 Tax=Ladona fulva TaxID=123851 RepID=A0A8K0JZP9_LADFU|nr:hypothetical protein J437_LFUL006685 [Ladona fulva]
MTVKHLQNVQRQQLAVAVATDPTVLHKFRTGFNECAGEVSRYIGRIEGVDPTVRSRLLAHLASCVSGLHQLTPFSFGAMAAAATPPPPQMAFPPQIPSSSAMPSPADEGGSILPGGPRSAMTSGVTGIPPFPPGDVNNNQSQRQGAAPNLMGGMQLIPSRLPSGELALLLPGSGRLSSEGENSLTFPTATTSPVTPTSLSIPGGPSPSASGSPPGHAHQSAFTAVTRAPSPPPPSIPHGPPSPASSTSSSCASNSCDSALFANSSPPSGTHQPSTEAPKFAHRFPCPPLPPSSLVGTETFSPVLLAPAPRTVRVIDSCSSDAKLGGSTEDLQENLTVNDREACFEPPRLAPEFSSAAPLVYPVCPPTIPLAAPTSMLPDNLISQPPSIFLPSPVPREVLDFSVKRERLSGIETDDEKSPRGIKRPISDDSEKEDDVKPAIKMARLEVKVEPSPLEETEDGRKSKLSEARVPVEVTADGCSSAVSSRSNTPSEGTSSLDMWRPW